MACILLAAACSDSRDDGDGGADGSGFTNASSFSSGTGSGADGTASSSGTGTGTDSDSSSSDATSSDTGTTTSTSTTTTTSTTSTDTSTGGDDCGVLQVTYRDFQSSHSDFESDGTSAKGIVEIDLGGDGKPVFSGDVTGDAGIMNAASFDQWYRDVAGVNQAIPMELELTETSPGFYTFSSNAFFPLDGMGFGNESNAHNFHFTTEIHAEFVYRAGQVFTFTGDDDLFLFINGKLAIDLGGTHPQETDTVDLDARAAELGITVGQKYGLDVFHAERHTVESNFRIDTSIDCFVPPQ